MPSLRLLDASNNDEFGGKGLAELASREACSRLHTLRFASVTVPPKTKQALIVSPHLTPIAKSRLFTHAPSV
jgi:hypothetical protein